MPDRPRAVAFDVNGTLSDLSPMAERFAAVGAPAHLARLWFAGTLRDGFALAAAGASAPFARIAAAVLRSLLERERLDRPLDEAAAHVLSGFGELAVHPDVPAGVRALRGLGLPLYTLSNGAAEVAERLLERAGLTGEFERFLSVENAPAWKPAPAAYAYAARECARPPRELMLVAVHPWDIDGAARVGLSTGWLNREGGSYPEHLRRPTVSARSLAELAQALARAAE